MSKETHTDIIFAVLESVLCSLLVSDFYLFENEMLSSISQGYNVFYASLEVVMGIFFLIGLCFNPTLMANMVDGKSDQEFVRDRRWNNVFIVTSFARFSMLAGEGMEITATMVLFHVMCLTLFKFEYAAAIRRTKPNKTESDSTNN